MSNLDPKNWDKYDDNNYKKMKRKKKTKTKKGKRYPKKQSDYRKQSGFTRRRDNGK